MPPSGRASRQEWTFLMTRWLVMKMVGSWGRGVIHTHRRGSSKKHAHIFGKNRYDEGFASYTFASSQLSTHRTQHCRIQSSPRLCPVLWRRSTTRVVGRMCTSASAHVRASVCFMRHTCDDMQNGMWRRPRSLSLRRQHAFLCFPHACTQNAKPPLTL